MTTTMKTTGMHSLDELAPGDEKVPARQAWLPAEPPEQK